MVGDIIIITLAELGVVEHSRVIKIGVGVIKIGCTVIHDVRRLVRRKIIRNDILFQHN